MLVKRLDSFDGLQGSYSLVDERVIASNLNQTDAEIIIALWNHKLESKTPTPILLCATCHKPIEDGKYAVIGRDWIPPVPTICHPRCAPPLKAAAEEQQATINHKLDKLAIEAEPLIPGLWSSRPAIPWPYRIEGL